jgi:toxin ParE1/3/4
MSCNVEYTEIAESDLHGIYEYIAFNLLVPNTAKKQVSVIMDEISKLDENPFRFPVYKKEPWHSKGLRFFPVNNYVVFYLPDEEKNTVTVIRIMYGGRNIEEQLKN